MPEPVAAPQYFIDPSGDTVEVQPADVATAIKSGYLPASPKQVEEFHQLDAFQRSARLPTSESLKAGAAGFGRGLTFGASDWLLTHSTDARDEPLATPERLQQLKEQSPAASVVGEMAGIAAPLVLSGGAAAPEVAATKASGGALETARAAARLAPSSLASRAGHAVTGAVERALPKAEGAVGEIVNKAIASGAGSAVEGAAYGLGQVVSEAALGDPNLTAESAVSEVGLSSLLMGSVGAAGGVMGQLLRKVPSKDLGKKLGDWVGEFEGERNVKAAGGIQSDIARVRKQVGREQLVKIGQEMGDLGLVDALSTPAKTLERAQALQKTAGEEMGAILKKADRVFAEKPDMAAKIDDLIGRAKQEILKPLAENPLQQGAKNTIENTLNGYLTKFAKEGEVIAGKGRLEIGPNGLQVWKQEVTPGGTVGLQELHEMRRQVSEAIYGFTGMQDPAANATKAALHDFRTMISDEITRGVERAGESSAAWKAANRRYQVATKAEDFATRGIDRAHGNNLVSLTEGLGALGGGLHGGAPGAAAVGLATAAVRRHASNVLGSAAGGLRRFLEGGAAESVVNKTAEAIAASRQAGTDAVAQAASTAPETVAALAHLERMNQRATAKIDAAAESLARGVRKAATVAKAELAAGSAGVVAAERQDPVRLYEKRVAEVKHAPEVLLEKLTGLTDGLHEHAPNTAQALQVSTARALSFLASKVPEHPPAGPLASKWKPSATEIATFNRYYDAVQKPASILAQASAGTLTPEAVEAVKTVYPQLYAKMTAAVYEKIAEHGPEAVPYKSRLMLGLLLGQTLDGLDAPGMLQRNAATFAGPSAKGPDSQPAIPPPIRPTAKGAGSITLSSRMLTPSQASGQRR